MKIQTIWPGGVINYTGLDAEPDSPVFHKTDKYEGEKRLWMNPIKPKDKEKKP
jgi:hypothetical protein